MERFRIQISSKPAHFVKIHDNKHELTDRGIPNTEIQDLDFRNGVPASSLAKSTLGATKNHEKHQLERPLSPLKVFSTVLKSLGKSGTIMDLEDTIWTFSIRPLTIVLQGDQVGDFAKINVFQGFEALFQLLRARVGC